MKRAMVKLEASASEGAHHTTLAALHEALSVADILRFMPFEVVLWQAQNIWNDLLRRSDATYWSAEWKADFTKLGIDPKAAKILVVKSGYLEPQIKAIANPNLMALTDGSINQDIIHLPKNRYRPPTYPFVEDLEYTPHIYVSVRSRA